MAKKSDDMDDETRALIDWCVQVEQLLVKAGATTAQAQEHIEEYAEWFTDMYYDGLTPEQAAQEALNDPE